MNSPLFGTGRNAFTSFPFLLVPASDRLVRTITQKLPAQLRLDFVILLGQPSIADRTTSQAARTLSPASLEPAIATLEHFSN